MAIAPVLLVLVFVARFRSKKFDIGIGPEPILSHPYHQKALALFGYTSQTFVQEVYDIFDDFQLRFDTKYKGLLGETFRPLVIFNHIIFNYKILYFYFTGGPLSKYKAFLWRWEPTLLTWARVKTVVMPYGGDVQDTTRNPNLIYKNGLSIDYPKLKFNQKRISDKIGLWTRKADHIIGGLDWVDYLYAWDTLMISHFGIDTDQWQRSTSYPNNKKLRILHAPNHRKLKGTQHIIKAIAELNAEGYELELVLRERVKNEEIKASLENIDIVVDQLIIGWYAMFAMEAMSMEIPVICYLREDLLDLYEENQLLVLDEIPIINANWKNVKSKLKYLADNKEKLESIGRLSRKYIEKYHSIPSLGNALHIVNQKVLSRA